MQKWINMNKKGSAIDAVIWIIIAFIVVMFFGVWVYMHGTLTNVLTTIPSTDPNVNISQAAVDTFGQVDASLGTSLRFMSYAILFALMLSIFIANYLTKANPIFFVVYVFTTIAAVIASVFISNAYETLLTNSLIGATLLTFKVSNFIMLNLPVWATVIGLVGAVFLFINVTRDTEGAGGL